MEMLNLSKDDSLKLLDLRKESMNKLCLEKPILAQRPARVGLVLDYSGSMSTRYKNGTVQAIIERFLPLALKFDDNGEMEVWIFTSEFHRLPNITIDNFYGYVKREILDKGYDMGWTPYAPVMKDIIKRYMQEEPAKMPNYIAYITDGNNDDKKDTKNTIINAATCPIFWQFIGIGNETFDFLEMLDDIGGRYVDNANFFALNDILKIDDDELYNRIMEEYPQWLALPEVQAMIENPQMPSLTDEAAARAEQSVPKKKKLFGKLFK